MARAARYLLFFPGGSLWPFASSAECVPEETLTSHLPHGKMVCCEYAESDSVSLGATDTSALISNRAELSPTVPLRKLHRESDIGFLLSYGFVPRRS
jgi:hypothetical protein